MTTGSDVDFARTYEQLEQLSRANIRATSPRGHARVTATGHDYRVEVRANGFDKLPPETLAGDVVAAYFETMRASRRATQRILANQPDGPSPSPESVARWHAVLREQRAGISVRVVSSQRLVRGSWSGIDDVALRITAVNAAHREMLEQEISEALTLLSREYRRAMTEATRAAAEAAAKSDA